MREVPVEELIDLASLRSDGRPPTPKQIREALPPGWALSEDNVTAFRDGRLFFKDGWVMILGLVSFGVAGLGFFWFAMPRGWAGFGRLAATIGIVAVAGGLVAPLITRALNRPTRKRRDRDQPS